MKQITLTLLAFLAPLALHAQRVWTEGTTWDVEYTTESGLPHTLFRMEPDTLIDGVSYFPLTATTDSGCDTLAYIRSEHGDSMVYVRYIAGDGMGLLPDTLLYDFSKPFCYGDTIHYGTAHSGVQQMVVDKAYDTLLYCYNVLEEGDSLPVWRGLVYMLGHVEGPLALFLDDNPTGGESDTHPKSSNVSHILFGTKGHTAISLSFTSGDSQLDGACQRFGFQLMNRIETMQNEPDNIVMSPLSAWIALSMLQNGAAGNTLAQMQQAMLTTGCTVEQVNSFNRQLSESLKDITVPEWYATSGDYDPESLPVTELANSIWSDEGYPFYDTFYQANTDYYDASLGTLDLSLQVSTDSIDRWVNEKTHGTIPSVNVTPDDALVMMLINALYFKGGWSSPFDEYNTSMKPFLNDGTTQVDVPTMRNTDWMPYSHTDGYQAVKLYYGYDNKFSMTLYLSDETGTPFTADLWKQTQQSMTQTMVSLELPRFETDVEMELKEMLKAMGMTDAFSPVEADFSLLSPLPTCTGMVKQLCHIAVDEKGTVASAVTVITQEATSIEPVTATQVSVNRPFYYTIEDNQTGCILFIGHQRHIDSNANNAITQLPDHATRSAPAYDLSGRRLPSTAIRKGLYIQDGHLRH